MVVSNPNLFTAFVCPLPGGVRAGLTLPVRVDPTGRRGPTRSQSRGPLWQRTSHGYYVPADGVPQSPEQRILQASMVLPAVSGITGWAALRWAGAFWFSGTTNSGALRPITLLTADHNIRSQPGLVVCQERISLVDWRVLDGVPSVDPTHALAFEMRYARTAREAGVAFEMAAYNDLVSISEITDLLSQMNGWTGIPKAREIVPFLDENAWSPQEVLLRHLWQFDANLPRPLTNRPVFDRYGHHLGTPDLLDEEAGVVIEYDGADHLMQRRRKADLRREERLRQAGLEYLTVVAGDMPDREDLISRLLAVRSLAAFAAPAHRSWTTELPRWWVPAFTVDQRRELSEDQRRNWLRTRRSA